LNVKFFLPNDTLVERIGLVVASIEPTAGLVNTPAEAFTGPLLFGVANAVVVAETVLLRPNSMIAGADAVAWPPM
jgi:hypothetical protein